MHFPFLLWDSVFGPKNGVKDGYPEPVELESKGVKFSMTFRDPFKCWTVQSIVDASHFEEKRDRTITNLKSFVN
jgi:hypothetical protein